jgi:beta-glucosidase/6-phospho-beta-glucosidase/beta-galactosidase
MNPESVPPRTRRSGFLWGVATSGYQSEGGYNGPGQPQNNWSEAEDRTQVASTGTGARFWEGYREDFERCRALGLNAFRLSLEWTRIQPTVDRNSRKQPVWDEKALADYAVRLAACREHGLEPLVTLHHFTHPLWLGIDAWLQDETPALFEAYVRGAVRRINRLLIDVHGQPPLRWFITINEPNMLVLNTYLRRQFPGNAPSSIATITAAYNRLLAAHVRAYNAIHDIYAAENWTVPRVSMNTYSSDLYWSDKIIWDLLSMREFNFRFNDWNGFLGERAREFDEALQDADLPVRRTAGWFAGRAFQSMANWLHHLLFNAEALEFYHRELERSPRAKLFDFTAIDYYDPFSAHLFRLPTFSDLEMSMPSWHAWVMEGVTRKWWDWKMLPEGLSFFCRHYSAEYQRPVIIAENGMALRRRSDQASGFHRGDRITRSQFLNTHVAQVIRLVRDGVPVEGYFHWSLTDNYEWGSFTPRFGLYTLDYTDGARRMTQDHLGDEPSLTYAKLIRQSGF